MILRPAPFVCGQRCNLGEDAHQVSAENFVQVFCGVAAVDQGFGDPRQISGGVDAFGQRTDAVEVSADADVVCAGDADDVVEMVNERGEQRPWDTRGEVTVDAVGSVEWDWLLAGGEFCVEGSVRSGALFALRCPVEPVVLVDEGREEVDHAEAAVSGERTELIVGEVAR